MEEGSVRTVVGSHGGPMLHFLLSCSATAGLRALLAPAANAAGGRLLRRCEVRAALTLRHAPKPVLVEVLRAAPPPP